MFLPFSDFNLQDLISDGKKMIISNEFFGICKVHHAQDFM